jgi:hypothetical protein
MSDVLFVIVLGVVVVALAIDLATLVAWLWRCARR